MIPINRNILTSIIAVLCICMALSFWMGLRLGGQDAQTQASTARQQLIEEYQAQAELLRAPNGEFYWELPGEAFDH